MPKYHFNFPRVSRDVARSINLQAVKIMEEADEVEREVSSIVVRKMQGKQQDYTRLVEETLDLIHSCETMLGILLDEKVETEGKIGMIRESVIVKNRSRGYYGGGKVGR